VCAGIWREGADGTDINACCRSHNQQLLASADDFGSVNLYEYPSSQPRVLYLLSVCVSVCVVWLYDRLVFMKEDIIKFYNLPLLYSPRCRYRACL